MSNRYGLPYQGSKSKIAEEIAEQIPRGNCFVDLFCGGGAISHYMMEHNRYKSYVMNDITNSALAFRRILEKGSSDFRDWVSREDFFKLGSSVDDTIRKMIWSFGNDQRTYIYSEANEKGKKALHYAIVFGDYSLMHELSRIAEVKGLHKRYMAARRVVKELARLQPLESLERLQSLERLESLERLQSMESDYRSVAIPPNSVVYCDIPYARTTGYHKDKAGRTFDHEAFFEWARTRSFPVYISEYNAPSDFRCIWKKNIRCTLCATDNSKVATERLFLHEKFKFNKKQGELWEL
jgi:site-specific DNA-adenine methylase